MPYKIAKVKDKFQVEKEDGTPVGAPHDTKEEADKHLAALEINVGDAKEALKPRRTGYFSELVTLEEADINGDAKSVRVTLIRPGWSANGRFYPREVLGKAISLFEGGKAYADHPGQMDAKNRPERSIRDLVGWYNGVQQESDGRITANLNVVDNNMWPTIVTAATTNPNYAGLSINALGDTREGIMEGKRGIIVEEIVKHNSTDIVTTPAAGGKFEQLIASDSDEWTRDLIEAMSLDQLTETLREVRPDLVKTWQKEWKTPRDNEALKAARAEMQSLKTKLAEAEKQIRTNKATLKKASATLANEKRVALVDRLLAESKLPESWRKDIRTRLIKAKDEKEMSAILENEIRKASSLPKPLAVKGTGTAIAPGSTSGRGAGALTTIAESFGATHADLANAADYNDYVRRKYGKVNN